MSLDDLGESHVGLVLAELEAGMGFTNMGAEGDDALLQLLRIGAPSLGVRLRGRTLERFGEARQSRVGLFRHELDIDLKPAGSVFQVGPQVRLETSFGEI